ncbi:MAG: cytochrome C biogenesis protein [Treponema sp. GWB1_62_6]|nr:MAG: cytochrome C biogenesis protein [Treponema sp. GWA1_62_8]OHE65508.1 MAG: cytochrome C biogenesis protein [Treponema sp. GWC1_61_84]OHE65734.1 MAG: cytochrome C biogenesis protein [Treponema sp. GWB1_62_6]OHE77100.1 MAG: cytochrome C biogenesis protein [Treponema sp. RIFOXYC1_FULL_61_9]HCM27711.1 cytochrome C biogenesis protein [Treponema sp.]
MIPAIPAIAFILLLAAAALQAIRLFRPGGKGDPVSVWLLAAAALLLFGFSLQRSFEIGFAALTSTFESLVFYAAVVALVVALYRFQRRIPFSPFVAFASTFFAAALLAVASSPLLPKDALPPIPALNSSWLALHVAFSFIGEAFFVVSFASSLAFLFSGDADRRLALDRVTYAAIAVGYPIFTAGALVFGAIWAERAWGHWWSWDPKETWALVTWLVYTAYLHVRLVMKRKDALASAIAVVGFVCTVFTFFGVNYLLPGLHSYG